MSDPIDNAPDVDVPVEQVSTVDPAPVEPVDIPEGWASMHWKQIVALARKIAGDIEITVEDARRIIGDEMSTRDASQTEDGLVAMTKNGDVLHVNPATVDAHKRVGWAIV